jgi:hypothetical protein
MEYMTDLIKIDKNGNPYYSQETLNLILRCLNEEQLLKEMNQLIHVGTCHLSTYINYFKKIKEYFVANQ